MEFFLDQVQMILPVLGFDFTQPRPGAGAREGAASESPVFDVPQVRGFLRNADVREALGVERERARDLLRVWVEDHWLIREGERKGTKYFPGPRMSL